MHQTNVHLLDLPNEILFLILKRLNNIDVLYSLFGISNQRLNIIAEDGIFTDTLNFVSTSQATDTIHSISDSILTRFHVDILPRIHQQVKSLTITSDSLECVLGAAVYPNLTELQIFNFNQTVVSRHFNDDCSFGHIYKHPITDLTLIMNENNGDMTSQEYTKNVYATIFAFFKHLQHLTIALASIDDPLQNLGHYSQSISRCAIFTLHCLPSTTFSSSILTKLRIDVFGLSDCLALLDGRLKQLSTFIVQIEFINDRTSPSVKRENLPNFKIFSLICYHKTWGYARHVVPLLHRMSHLEQLTLYVHLWREPISICGSRLDDDILTHMPRLHSFTFHIAFENYNIDPPIVISSADTERTFTNHKYGKAICMLDYLADTDTVCRIFSLPFKFRVLNTITNHLPNHVFDFVTHLKLQDQDAFEDVFFVRLARVFPCLQNLCIFNGTPPILGIDGPYLILKEWCSTIEFPHLISLDMEYATKYYVMHFLNEKDVCLPRLTELKIDYLTLEKATENFTNEKMRCTCAKVKRLLHEHSIVYSKDVCNYFPLLSV